MKSSAGLLIVLLVLACKPYAKQSDVPNQAEKIALLLTQIADEYKAPSPNIGDAEKYYWPVVIARFEKYGVDDSLANAYLDLLKDRSPFHFTLVGMARIMSAYETAHFIETQRHDLLKKVFERADSYNPWTNEGTENHINMSKTSGYLFAQHALAYPAAFPDASQKMALIKDWMKSWSRQIFQTGTGEWNSSIYQAYNILGWLNVYDFAEDKEVRTIAKAVLDFYAVEMALHYSWGITGGSEMRGTGATLDGTSATAYFYWLWFSPDLKPLNGFRGSQYIQAVHAATSTYRPHAVIRQLAMHKPEEPVTYRGSKPSYNFEEASFVKQTYMAGAHFTLGNCVSNYGGFTGASYQMVPWKLVVKDSLPQVVSGNGFFFNDFSGKTRSPFTQSVQHRNVLIQLTRVPHDAPEIMTAIDSVMVWWNAKALEDLSYRFPRESYKLQQALVNAPASRNYANGAYLTFPKDTKIERLAVGYMARLGNVSLFFRSLHPANDSIYQQRNRTIVQTGSDVGTLCGFVLEVLDDRETPRYAESFRLIDGTSVAYTTSAGEHLLMRYQQAGQYTEPMVDWGFGPREPVTENTSPPFFQPEWASCASCGRVPALWVDEQEVDYSSEWPVFSGPGIHMADGVLQLTNTAGTYQIDYTGDWPEMP